MPLLNGVKYTAGTRLGKTFAKAFKWYAKRNTLIGMMMQVMNGFTLTKIILAGVSLSEWPILIAFFCFNAFISTKFSNFLLDKDYYLSLYDKHMKIQADAKRKSNTKKS